MRADEIMTTRLVTAAPADTVQQLARLLTEAGISGAPVLDERGRLIGIVSEADVISKRGRTVGDVMNRTVVSVPPDTAIEKVCEIMARHNINRVPIIRGGDLVGIITRTDVVRAIAQGNLEANTLRTAAEPAAPAP